jgi:hypothetical protein
MPVIHIDLIKPGENENEYKRKKAHALETLHDHLNGGKHVFALIHMTGCGPCQSTKPKWLGLESKFKDNQEVCVVDIEHTLLDSVNHANFKKDIRGFPTMRHIKGRHMQNYEDVEGIKKDRSLESFIRWLEMKTSQGMTRSQNSMKGGRRKKKGGKYPLMGGKWSKKYKDSINCNRPKGFSQRQHCKYGRKKHGGNFSVRFAFDVKTGKTKARTQKKR